MDDITTGKLIELCQMVYRGAKPCAMLPVMDKDFKNAKRICMLENCKFKAGYLSDGWKTLWVYTRDELPGVIDSLPVVPKSESDHYLLGALFGYSNEEICNYLKNLL